MHPLQKGSSTTDIRPMHAMSTPSMMHGPASIKTESPIHKSKPRKWVIIDGPRAKAHKVGVHFDKHSCYLGNWGPGGKGEGKNKPFTFQGQSEWKLESSTPSPHLSRAQETQNMAMRLQRSQSGGSPHIPTANAPAPLVRRGPPPARRTPSAPAVDLTEESVQALDALFASSDPPAARNNSPPHENVHQAASLHRSFSEGAPIQYASRRQSRTGTNAQPAHPRSSLSRPSFSRPAQNYPREAPAPGRSYFSSSHEDIHFGLSPSTAPPSQAPAPPPPSTQGPQMLRATISSPADAYHPPRHLSHPSHHFPADVHPLDMGGDPYGLYSPAPHWENTASHTPSHQPTYSPHGGEPSNPHSDHEPCYSESFGASYEHPMHHRSSYQHLTPPSYSPQGGGDQGANYDAPMGLYHSHSWTTPHRPSEPTRPPPTHYYGGEENSGAHLGWGESSEPQESMPVPVLRARPRYPPPDSQTPEPARRHSQEVSSSTSFPVDLSFLNRHPMRSTPHPAFSPFDGHGEIPKLPDDLVDGSFDQLSSLFD